MDPVSFVQFGFDLWLSFFSSLARKQQIINRTEYIWAVCSDKNLIIFIRKQSKNLPNTLLGIREEMRFRLFKNEENFFIFQEEVE